MAKFSFDDADDEPPLAASGGEKRKRGDDVPDDAAAGGGPLKIRNSVVTGGGPERNAAVTGASSWEMVETAGGNADGAISVRIDPEVLDCSICFEPLQPPLYQVPPPQPSPSLLKLHCLLNRRIHCPCSAVCLSSRLE